MRKTFGSAVPLWGVLIAIAIAAVIGTVGGGLLGSQVLAETAAAGSQGAQGEAGPAGPAGLPGARGPRGSAVDPSDLEDAVWQAIEDDPQRAAQEIQEYLDPDPSDVSSAVDEVQVAVDGVQNNFDDLCSSLTLTDAMSSEILPC